MKKTLIIASLLLSASTSALFSQQDTFDPLDNVRMGPGQEAVYDTFYIGDGSQSYSSKRWITPFAMSRYEVTYYLWYETKTWGEKNGYTFSNPGQSGSHGRRGAVPLTREDNTQPVVMISWNDAIVWCNALSEKKGLTPCYSAKGSVIKNSEDAIAIDEAVCDFEADGYRLPTEAEWEYAARKTKSGFQSGALVSGQVDEQGKDSDTVLEEEVAWTANNADRTRTVGTAGTPFERNAPPAPTSGNPNGAGLFDMSGNVLEWCWDWMGNYRDTEPGSRATGADYGKGRVCRGGSFSIYTPFCYAGDRYSYDPSEHYDFLGFRVCRTIK